MAFINQIPILPLRTSSSSPSRCRTFLSNPKSLQGRFKCHVFSTVRACEGGTNAAAGPEDSAMVESSSSCPIPGSFVAACDEARTAMLAALSNGERRIFIEMDTTNGDATYTALKTATPTVLAMVRAFEENSTGAVKVIFPDAGAAALAKRDWEGANSKATVVGLEQFEMSEDDVALLVVVPRASEVRKLAALVRNAGDLPVIVVNPDLVDMGVTGLSLNARTLRTEVIDLFDSAYFLRVYPWGVLFRRYAEQWGVWVDDANETSGFRCVSLSKERPGGDRIEEILDADMAASGDPGAGPIAKAIKGFQRFLDVYTKG